MDRLSRYGGEQEDLEDRWGALCFLKYKEDFVEFRRDVDVLWNRVLFMIKFVYLLVLAINETK